MSLMRRLQPPQLREFDIGERKATWLELFFDLCFVVAVSAVSTVLHENPTGEGIRHFAFYFIAVWWAWMGYTWYATAFDNDDLGYRVTMLFAMMGVLGLARNVPIMEEGFANNFVPVYAFLQGLLVWLWIRAYIHNRQPDVRSFCMRYAIGFGIGIVVWLSSLLFPTEMQPRIWVIAIVIQMITPIWAFNATELKMFDSAHLPERYGLFTLIVIGEAVLSVGSTIPAGPVTGAGFTAAVPCFVVAAAIWWIYFDRAEPLFQYSRRRTMFIWGYGHLLIYAGIAATGAGASLVIHGALEDHHADGGMRAVFCGGIVVCLLGMTLVHGLTRTSIPRVVLPSRLVAAAAIAAVGIFGGGLWATTFAVVVAAIMFALAVLELLTAPEVEPHTMAHGHAAVASGHGSEAASLPQQPS